MFSRKPEHLVKAGIASALDSLMATLQAKQDSMSDAERAKAEADYAEFLERCKTDLPVHPAKRLTLKLDELNSAGASLDEGIKAVLHEIATLYAWPPDDPSRKRVEFCVHRYGPKPTRLAAIEMLNEGYNPDVRNPWSILTAKAAEFSKS